MKKIISVGLIVLSLFSCARPKYFSATENLNGVMTFANAAYDIEFILSETPVVSKMQTAQILFHPKGQINQFVDPSETIKVELWMPSMGHGSSPTKIERLGQGIYLVNKIYFIMGGTWDIRIQLRQGDQFEQVIKTISL